MSSPELTPIDLTLAESSALTEDLALALLQRPDFPPQAIEDLSKNPAVNQLRKVKLAIVGHPKTPRYVALAVLRQLFTFDLMRVALTPIVPGDIKVAAEEALINRLPTLPLGQRFSLARRSSGRVAAALLLDADPKVLRATLENARLTETPIVRTLMREQTPAAMVHAVCQHPKWSLRREIRMALLRNRHTPAHLAQEYARSLPAHVLKEILENSQLPATVRSRLHESL
jgi:hypothetical protein